MGLHSWWNAFGSEVASADKLSVGRAQELAHALVGGAIAGVTLIAMKKEAETESAAVYFEIEVERPQVLEFPIRAIEPVAAVFRKAEGPPSILALRADFPDTPHQNWTPDDAPCSLCVDDRPWAEAKLSATPFDLVRRVQLWLAKAARGELHDPAQPLDPLFFGSLSALLLPASALAESTGPEELVASLRPDNPHLIIAHRPHAHDRQRPGFIVVAFHAQPQTMGRFRYAPATLAALALELEKCGIDLYDEIKKRLKAWAGLDSDNIRRLSCRVAIVVAFPVIAGGARSINDVRAFLTHNTAGAIGVGLGVLHQNASQVGARDAYVAAIPERPVADPGLSVVPMPVHFTFDRIFAASIAGHDAPDARRVVLVGAGSLGSQVAMDLAREGSFSWTVVDSDFLLPHNLARHALLAEDVGAPKAAALARQLGGILGEAFGHLQCDVMNPGDESAAMLADRLAEAEVILDASASVAASRYLADHLDAGARRLCAFFNPAGTAVVVLAESADRSITLRDLEAQYHRLVLTEPLLADHLENERDGVRYSGSCRALTNRIPATRAALLSALAARGVRGCLRSRDAGIRIWTVTDDGEVRLIGRDGARVHRVTLGAWQITYDEGVLSDLTQMRESKLPQETGGVLLGIADMSRKSIHVAHALSEPEDSQGTSVGFERGVSGVLDEVNRAVERSMYQLRYVGEWHSHPRHSSAMPSQIDIAQIEWLGRELAVEGQPGLMAIAAEDGQFGFVVHYREAEAPGDDGAAAGGRS
jgi:hypothetical protein